jgi:hypothetical protein
MLRRPLAGAEHHDGAIRKGRKVLRTCLEPNPNPKPAITPLVSLCGSKPTMGAATIGLSAPI